MLTTQKHTDFYGGQELSPTLLRLTRLQRETIALPPPPKMAYILNDYLLNIFLNDYLQQQLILIKPSQNIKLIRPTTVVGIYNS